MAPTDEQRKIAATIATTLADVVAAIGKPGCAVAAVILRRYGPDAIIQVMGLLGLTASVVISAGPDATTTGTVDMTQTSKPSR